MDFTTLSLSELDAKQRWYEARGTRFLDQIAAIRAEIEARRAAASDQEPTNSPTDENEGEPDTRIRSVVHPRYKARYGKARGCGDWLHQTLADLTLRAVVVDEDGEPSSKLMLDVAEFDAILLANGINPHNWNRHTPGWQGRLRMSGRACLVSVVRREGGFRLTDGSQCAAPATFLAQITKAKPEATA